MKNKDAFQNAPPTLIVGISHLLGPVVSVLPDACFALWMADTVCHSAKMLKSLGGYGYAWWGRVKYLGLKPRRPTYPITRANLGLLKVS